MPLSRVYVGVPHTLFFLPRNKATYLTNIDFPTALHSDRSQKETEMPPDTTDRLRDRWLDAKPTYISDLRAASPEDAVLEEPARGKWHALDYEADGMSGTMLIAGPETGAPEVELSLDVDGWHAVSIGVFDDSRTPLRFLTRLSGDETFDVLALADSGGRDSRLTELYWKTTDLTNQGLVLAQEAWQVAQGDGPGAIAASEARIAYIKLVPLFPADIHALEADRDREDTRLVFAHNDAHTVHFASRPTTAEEIRRHIEPYRDSDISRLYWEAGIGDLVFYNSDIGTMPTADGLDDFYRQGDRILAESWRAFRDKGIDPFEIALDYAHEIGLEFHASYRPAGFRFPAPHEQFNRGAQFYLDHPELRGTDRHGNETPRIAYSYPETRSFVVSLLKEMAGYAVDGISVLYNRRPPLVEYETPLVEGFKKEHGQDPRRLDPNDPRWLSYRCGALTQFHRELRAAVDEAAKGRGLDHRLEITAVVMSSEEENLVNGMDLRTWISEGLVDTIVPYASVLNLDSMADSWTDISDLDFFIDITLGTACKLAPNLMPREISSEDYRTRAAAIYNAGAENIFLWDTDAQQPRLASPGPWDVAKRLGHRNEIESWIRAGQPNLAVPTRSVTKLGDWDLGYSTPG
jgi:hypothetical protein